ncbi:kinase-like domain-containing protein [Gamsiella multidivaricata]|uniref:kinase-like domain-containing protein n=1 Tax=Gamsiella multidivaricata TaxID=101098 RepID=UPI00221F92A7|nr:kinase-like domain-containing protein [Gamsiella multidivaricata]KAI7816015.1 kinase-like domain-containing protein [Gamsiella multidivaricata]
MSGTLVNRPPESWGKLGEIPPPSPKTFIGNGAFGEVYWWNRDGTMMAVKRLRTADGDDCDIKMEAKIVSLLAHRHIIQCYGVELDDLYAYIITDYAAGGSLTKAIPRLDWSNKRRIVAEVARGLGYLHSMGIIHKDIKGDNILLTEHDEVRLCDFGLASVINSAVSVSKYGQMGTPGYAAPELMSTNPKFSDKSDVFALGIVMREMLDQNAPPDYTVLMTRCIDADPNNRPTTDEIEDALQVPGVHNDVGGDSADETAHNLSADDEYDLGLRQYSGDGVKRNRAEAAERFRRASNMGHAKAQYQLAEMYRTGDGILQDYTKSVEWYRKAADQGYAPAQTCLGLLFLTGSNGVSQDHCLAQKTLKMAADNGDTKACTHLASMYLRGCGVAQNNDEAIRWYLEAAKRGDVEAQCSLADMYVTGDRVERDYDEAYKCISMAVEQDYAPAQYGLGMLYLQGQGISQSDSEAVKWFRKAADQGNPDAQHRLGVLYLEGKGVRKNKSKGMVLLRKAADQGNIEARVTLAFNRLLLKYY